MDRTIKLNEYKAYDIRTYLAYMPERLKINLSLINHQTNLINNNDFSIFIEILLKKYNTHVNKKLLKLLTIKDIFTYFDLYEFIIKNNINIQLESIKWIKKEGFREFYYAIKNYQETSSYDEGTLFGLINDYDKSLITLEDIIEKTQKNINLDIKKNYENLSNSYIKFNRNNTTLHDIKNISYNIQTLTDIDIGCTSSSYEKTKDFKKRYKETKHYFFNKLSKEPRITLGLNKSKNLFKRDQYLTIKQNSHFFIAGLHCGVADSMYGLICENFLNNKGFLFFDGLGSSRFQKLQQMAQYFYREDDLVFYNFEDTDFKNINFNHLIKNNKIIFIMYPSLDRQSPRIIDKVINSLVSMFFDLEKLETPDYSIYLGQLPYESMSFDQTKKITDVCNLLTTRDYNCFSFHSLYNYLKEDSVNYLLDNIEHLCLMKQEDLKESKKYLDLHSTREKQVNKLDVLEFYYFKNRILVNNNVYKFLYPTLPLSK